MKYKLFGLICVLALIAGGALWWGHGHPRNKSPSSASQSTAKSGKTSSTPTFNTQRYSIGQPDSLWVVVNKQRPLSPLTYVPTDLVIVGNGQSMRTGAAAALRDLFAAAKAKGYNLVAESAYRSFQTQSTVYNREVHAFGKTKADSESARPGYSEHQTGWAVDIGAPGCYEDCFGKTAAASWVKANAFNYGFLLRYPADKVAITGYRNEPWHFRYVGPALALELRNRNVTTLEEFFGLPAAPSY